MGNERGDEGWGDVDDVDDDDNDDGGFGEMVTRVRALVKMEKE